MSVASTIVGTAERVPLPDLVIRAAIQRLCSRLHAPVRGQRNQRCRLLGTVDAAADRRT